MKKVLIVDDEQGILDVWVMHFKMWKLPVEIHLAPNGLDALHLVDLHGKFDMIITDYWMPLVDGLEFIKSLKTQGEYDTTPIFFFTGATLELIPEIETMNNVMLFEKPLITPMMISHIRLALEKDMRPIESL